MKTQIRRGIFETNSSSVHSISISNTLDKYDKSTVLVAEPKEFGWKKISMMMQIQG